MIMDDPTWKILTETDDDVVPNAKITSKEYTSFVLDWHGGKHPWERFGQAFINKFLRTGPVRMPNLFHTNDTDLAKKIVVDTFVDWTK